MYPAHVRLWDALASTAAKVYANTITTTDASGTYEDYIINRCYEHAVGEVVQWLDRRYTVAVKKHNSSFINK